MPVVIDTSTGVEPTPTSGRQTFPNAEDRLVYTIEGASDFRPAVARLLRVYSDAGATTLADIQTLAGAAIANSELTVDGNSLLPEFKGPDGVDTLYVKPVGGSTVTRITANNDARLDALNTSLSGIVTGSGFVPATQLPTTPEAHGAVGNGTTDDTTAMLAAIATGRAVWGIPGKTYLISAKLTLQAGQIFDGRGATIKRAAQVGAAKYHLLDCGIGSIVRGWNFNGNRATWLTGVTWDTVIEITTAARTTVENNYFTEIPGEAIVLYFDDVTVRNNVMLNVDGNGVHLSGSSRAKIVGNVIRNANLKPAIGHADGAISFSNEVYDCLIDGNHLDTAISGVGGLDHVSNRNVTITNNTIRNMTTYAIEGLVPAVDDMAGLVFVGNRVYDSQVFYWGQVDATGTVKVRQSIITGNVFVNTRVQLFRLNNTLFANNLVDLTGNTTNHPVWIAGGAGVSVLGNTLLGGSHGVQMQEALVDVKVANNTLRNQTSRGISDDKTEAGSNGVAVTGNTISNDNTAVAGYNGILTRPRTLVRGNVVTLVQGHSGIYPQTGASLVIDNYIRKGAATSSIRCDGGTAGIVLKDNVVDTAINNSGGASNFETGTVLVAV